MRLQNLLGTAALGLSLFAAACGGDRPADSGDQPAAASSQEASAPAPAATGRVIEVKMTTDEKGNYFEPNEIEAKQGDVLRFTLVNGVHNVDFPADRNPGKSGLPGPSPMLQLPGQTQDVPVTFEKGEYHFQCDPHAALGMVGKLRVE